MTSDQRILVAKAREILLLNRRAGYTLPTANLYPFQWNWDSGFVSIGLSNYDLDAAISEISTLLQGQWENGMIPHIIFHSENESTYFPNWDFWDAGVNAGAPMKPKTSGITQPPVLGFALESMWRKHFKNEKAKDFIKYAFPLILKNHKFWYDYRDPGHEGLAYIYHPWESGRDNSPIWDDSLDLIDLESANLPEYIRRDITITSTDERPTSKQYDQYVYLMLLGKRHRYEGPGIAEESEFLIQDSLINAMLIRSNESLIYLGRKLDFDVGQIEEWHAQSKRSYDTKLWHEGMRNYTGYDLRQNKLIPFKEIGGFTALFAGIPSPSRADKIKEDLENWAKSNFLLVPSFDIHHHLFDSKRYWRGPIWPQMNWLIYHGLRRYKHNALAKLVKENLIELVDRFGFHEYFEAQRHLLDTTHGGYGGDNFSWTASTIIDFLMED